MESALVLGKVGVFRYHVFVLFQTSFIEVRGCLYFLLHLSVETVRSGSFSRGALTFKMCCISLELATLARAIPFLTMECVLVPLEDGRFLVHLGVGFLVPGHVHHVLKVGSGAEELLSILLEHARSVGNVKSEKTFVISLESFGVA